MSRQGLHKHSCKVLMELCLILPSDAHVLARALGQARHAPGSSGDSPWRMDIAVSSLLLGPSTTYSTEHESWEGPGRTSRTIGIAAGFEKV